MAEKKHPFPLFLQGIVFTAFSAFAASLAFPGRYSEKGFPFLAFFSLVPLFCIVFRSRFRTLWLYGFEYGFLLYLFCNYWLETFHPLAIFIAPVLEGIQYAALLPLLGLARKLFPHHYGAVSWLFYNAYLYLTQQGFLAYPYGNLTSAVWSYTSLIQIVSITGIWGLGAVMTLPQCALAAVIVYGRNRKTLRLFTLSVLLLFAVWTAGFHMMKYYDEKEGTGSIRVAAIQHSADTWKGGYSTYRENFGTLCALTDEAMKENPDMVVWSETAFVPSVSWHQSYDVNISTRRLVERFVDYGKSLPVPLVTGNPEGVIRDRDFDPVLENGEWNWKTYNTVICFADGVIRGTYRKQHLVPFTEYFPYGKQFPHLYALLKANDYKWWERGEESVVFDYGGVSFSTPICFEDTFGYISAEFVRNGADAIINLSNDYWSRSVQAEWQHFALAVFRAVENRRPLLRSTNSGITALVLPSGKTEGQLEPFTQSWGIYVLPLGVKDGLTFYTRHPDLFGRLHVSLSVLLVLYALSECIYEKRRSKEM